MRVALLVLVAAGCASSEPSFDVLSPEQPSASAGAPVSAPPPEDFKISSEELKKNAEEDRTDQLTPPSPFGGPTGPVVEPTAEGPAATEAVAEAAPAAAAPPAAEPTPTNAQPTPIAAPSPSPWPVRLVKTLPEAQPPRAILGLPDGSEIVVTPGVLLAEQGLVVMGIGKASVDLAQVRAAGDHAEVTALSISAQY